jgi:hypothetical protein
MPRPHRFPRPHRTRSNRLDLARAGSRSRSPAAPGHRRVMSAAIAAAVLTGNMPSSRRWLTRASFLNAVRSLRTFGDGCSCRAR